MTERERLARKLYALYGEKATWGQALGDVQAGYLREADFLLVSGPWGLPAEGSPEEDKMVNRALTAFAYYDPAENGNWRMGIRAALRTGGGR